MRVMMTLWLTPGSVYSALQRRGRAAEAGHAGRVVVRDALLASASICSRMAP
jgi:hypothetical protein